MDWYQGSIPDAVAEVKNCQKILLVFVVGEDDLSKKMAETYNNSSVADKLNTNKCVALKLVVNSVPYQQFSQIYPVVVIPSSYFIGKNGRPIEIISGSLEPTEFIEKIEKIFQYENEDNSCKASTDTSAANIETTVDEPVNGNTVAAAEHNSSNVEEANPMEDQQENADEDDETLEERVQRAKNLIEIRRQNKAVEEEEDCVSSSSSSSARKKCVSSVSAAETGRKRMRLEETEDLSKERHEEQERRKVGKALQKAQQTRQENELKEWAQNRAREKEEERLARERVRAQIAQDRAERAAKYQQVKSEEAAVQREQELARQREEQQKAARDATMRSTTARLQFRLPDGASVTHQFAADATLSEVRNFVVEEVRPSFSSFTLCTTFPRRHFTEANYAETLRDLELAPSAAILILPGEAATVANPEGGFFNSIFWMLVSPFLTVWRAISSFFRRSPPPTAANRTPEPEPAPTGAPDADGPPATASVRRREARPQQRVFREGNVYRINNRPADDDDDNNTWNGNSTQQM